MSMTSPHRIHEPFEAAAPTAAPTAAPVSLPAPPPSQCSERESMLEPLAPLPAGPVASRTPPSQPGHASNRDALRALVVEDDEGVRRAVSRILSQAGFEVETARDGAEALSQLETEPVEVILSDINMPNVDGMTLLSQVRRRDQELPVILMTGMPTLDSAIQAVEDGAFQYVTKPFEPEQLCDAATRAAGYYRMSVLKREALALSGWHGMSREEHQRLTTQFEAALESLQMAYQPIVRAADGGVLAYETLMRPQHERLSNPGLLLSAAEQLDRLEELGRRIRALAATTMAEASDRGLLFINLHPEDLLDDALYRGDSPLARIADRVVLEITERASLDGIDGVMQRIQALRDLGFRIAVDDLGAGYAGLSSFAVLQPEFVKLDMSLVRDVDSNPLKRRLVQSMTDTCRELGIQVICEGVETEAERDVLREIGADLLQGYLLARPGPPFPDVEGWG